MTEWNIINRLRNEGALTFWVNYQEGHFTDKINGLTPTIVGSPKLSSKGLWTLGASDQLKYVSDVFSLTEFTLIYFGKIRNINHPNAPSNYNEVFCLYTTPATYRAEVYLQNSNGYPTIIQYIAQNSFGKKYIGFTHKNGETLTINLDGTNYNGTGVTNITAANAIAIGNYIGSTYQNMNITKQVLWCNRRLSATEHLDLYTVLNEMTSEKSIKKTSKASLISNSTENGLIFAPLMRNQKGVVVDQSVSAKNGTVYGCRTVKSPYFGEGLNFDGTDDNVTFSALPSSNMHTLEILAQIKKVNGPQLLVDSSGNGIYFNAGYVYYYSAAASCLLGTIGTNTDYHFHLMIVRNETYIEGFLNGVSLGVKTHPNSTGVSFDRLTISVNPTGNWQGNVYLANIYNYVWNANQVKNRYEEIKRNATWSTSFGAIESTATEGGTIGAPLSNTPFCFADSTGRYKVVSERYNGKILKSILCTTAGLLYLPTSKMQQSPTESAYGEWNFWFYPNTNGLLELGIVNNIADYNAVGQTGYWFISNSLRYQLYKSTGTDLAHTALNYLTASTWCNFKVIRSNSGVFTFYLNNQLVSPLEVGTNPVTDNTVTSANYIILGMGLNQKFSLSDETGAMTFKKSLLP